MFTVEDVNHWLTRFIVEIRKLNGDFFPQSLCICLLLGFYVREQGNTNNFMSEMDDRFLKVRKTLDAQMKLLTAKDYGSEIRQADPISKEQEEKLWTSEVIGYSTSESLLHGGFLSQL